MATIMNPSPHDVDPRHLERIAHNIHPGGWSIDDRRPLTTLLGSCVAVCLYDPVIRLAGMNHFLLPSQHGKGNDDTDIILAGDYSLEVLVNGMLARGARKERMVAKAFGGGVITAAIQTAIGERNSVFAREWLLREGIPLIASDFGGPWSRKVIFWPENGDIYCRRRAISTETAKMLLQEEKRYQESLERGSKTRRVELF